MRLRSLPSLPAPRDGRWSNKSAGRSGRGGRRPLPPPSALLAVAVVALAPTRAVAGPPGGTAAPAKEARDKGSDRAKGPRGAKAIDEALLARLARAPTFDAERFDPLALLDGADALVGLGPERALAALEALATRERGREGTFDRVALLARAAFACGAPWPVLPAGGWQGRPPDVRWPLYPLALEGELPLLVASGPSPAPAPAPDPAAPIAFARASCRLRATPLAPPSMPPAVVDGLALKDAWLAVPEHLRDRRRIRGQVMRALEGVLPPSPEPLGDLGDDAAWLRVKRRAAAARLAWDGRALRYRSSAPPPRP